MQIRVDEALIYVALPKGNILAANSRVHNGLNCLGAWEGAGRGAESSSAGTINLAGLCFIYRLLETQGICTKGEKCLGEPLAGSDRSCNGDLRELQGTDAKNHRTKEAALGRINSWLGGVAYLWVIVVF